MASFGNHTISKIDGHVVKRPSPKQPTPEHWQQLRELVKSLQGGRCGTCWAPGAELHHRHYDNFGNETIADVVLLCRLCHEAITNRIRLARAARGDAECLKELRTVAVSLDRDRPSKTQAIKPATKPVESMTRHKPMTRRGKSL